MKQLLAFFLFLPFVSLAQYGGESSYQFLNITNSARVEALGGTNISLNDSDIHFAAQNPALIDSSLHNSFGGTWGSVFIAQTDMGVGNAFYARTIGKQTYTFGMRFINYGAFQAYNELGEKQSVVSASEYAMSVGSSWELLPNVHYGIQLKPLASYMAEYSSYGIAADIGAQYTDTASQFTVALLCSNFGYQFKTYTKGNQQNMPFDAQLGVTKKLQHAPVRLSVAYRYLHQFDLSYDSDIEKSTSLVTDEEEEEDWLTKTGVNLMKHFVVGGELFIGRSISLAIGYDLKKANELKLADKLAGAGLSFGVGVKVSKFSLDFGHAKYHAAGATNYISLRTNIDELLTIKRTKKANVSAN